MSSNHDGHRGRLKERYVNFGIDSFEQHQILELLLFYAVARKDTNELAHELIARFGSISNVCDAPISELIKVKGISQHSATLIKLIPDLARVYLDDKNKTGDIFNTREAVVNYLRPKFVGKLNEIVAALFIDNRGKLVEFSIISEGAVNAAQVNMRKIMKLCMNNDATGVFLAHNHPRGLPLPSADDIETTKIIHNALAEVGVKLIDHFVFGEDGTCVSVSQSADYKRVFGIAQDQDGIEELLPEELEELYDMDFEYDI